jgi:hypothetical protein
LVLDNIDGLSSLAAELLESRIDAATANKVRWGPRFALVATLSHFSELKSKLEFGRKADLTEDQADTLWPLVDAASDSLASLIPSSIACDPPDGARE